MAIDKQKAINTSRVFARDVKNAFIDTAVTAISGIRYANKQKMKRR